MTGHQPKPKVKCKGCGTKFTPIRVLERYCPECKRGNA
jgi:Zn finger protein HypA/HybF involved in hydrogenase expression